MKPTEIWRRFTQILCGITAFALAAIAAPRATGDVVTFDWVGTIQEAQDLGLKLHAVFGDLNLLVGQPISGSFGYDTALPPSDTPVTTEAPPGAISSYILNTAEPGTFINVSLDGKTGTPGMVISGSPYSIGVLDNFKYQLAADTQTVSDIVWIEASNLRFAPNGASVQTPISPSGFVPDYLGLRLWFEAPPTLFAGIGLPENFNLPDYQVTGTLVHNFPEQLAFNLTSLTKREGPGRVPDGGSTALFLLLCLPALDIARRVSAGGIRPTERK